MFANRRGEEGVFERYILFYYKNEHPNIAAFSMTWPFANHQK